MVTPTNAKEEATCSTGDKEWERKEDGESGETDLQDGELQCGIGPCQPQALQRCKRLIFFTVSFSVTNFFAIMQGPLFASQVTSVERQFHINSTQLGALMSANDIGFLLLVLVVSHFAKDSHGPRMLSCATMVYGLASITIGLLNFVSPTSLQDNNDQLDNRENGSLHQGRGSEDRYLCLPETLNTTSTQRHCTYVGNSNQYGNDKLGLIVIMGLMMAVQGVTKATKSPLGVTYIDNNVPYRSRTGFHVGLMLTVTVFGPPIGFALGGFISRIPVDLSDSKITFKDPRWIGAWWIGFLVVGALTTLSGVPLLLFPKRMPQARKIDCDPERVENQTEDHLKGKEGSAKDWSSGTGTSKAGSPESAPRQGDAEIPSSLDAAKSGMAEAKNRNAEMDSEKVGKDNVAEGNDAVKTNESKEISKDTDLNNAQSQQPKLDTKLKELPLSLLRLIRDPVYVSLLLAFAAHLFAVIGFATFLIKFVERQFGLPPWLSAYVFGLSNLVCNGIGTFVGGVLVSLGNLTRRGCLRWAIFATSVSVALSAITIGLGCDPDNSGFVGFKQSSFTVDDGVTVCSCDLDQFLPVCDGNRTFLSPCHAGCKQAANATHFEDCSLAADGHVTLGLCSTGCHLMIPFIIVQVLANAFGSTTFTPIYVTIIRTASEKDKTLALGLLSFGLSIISFIPAPIVFGAVIDTSCLIWSHTCRAGKGPCSLYDVTQLRHNYIGLETGTKALAVVLFSISLLCLTWQVRKGRSQDDPPEKSLAMIGLKVSRSCKGRDLEQEQHKEEEQADNGRTRQPEREEEEKEGKELWSASVKTMELDKDAEQQLQETSHDDSSLKDKSKVPALFQMIRM